LSTTSNTNTGGIGFAGLLAIVFITLKLTGYSTWSWWWVLSPLWIPLAFVVTILLFVLIVGTATESLKIKRRK
jgi:hypothetical protein